MNNSNHQLKTKVMKRVYGFWFLRSMIPLLVIEFLGIICALYFFARFVFIGQVVNSALIVSLGNPYRFAMYFLSAFLNARHIVQALIILLLAVLAFILRDVNKSIISYAVMRRREFLAKSAGDERHD